MEPGEVLGIAAQIAVALAGFVGEVVVFRRESVHEWSPIDKLRLRLCGVAFVFFVLFVRTSGKIFRHLDLREAEHERFTPVVFYVVAVIGAPVLLLQLCNPVFLGASGRSSSGLSFN